MEHNDPPGDALLHACRTLAIKGLANPRAVCRRAAVRLVATPHVGLCDRATPLLKDVDAEVRVLALLAVGTREDLVPTDDLLPLLHDSNPEVRAICEQAMRSRGLSRAELQLARAMVASEPSVRASVPSCMADFPELDTAMWLERLSRDSSPAVRAAVARAAADTADSPLQDRLREMAAKDPSPTVRQIAEFYVTLRR